MRDILIIAVILGSAPICFFNPYFGVLMWSFVAYFNPHRFAWGAAYNFPAAAIVAVPTLAGVIFTRKVNRGVFVRETVLLVLLWMWFGVTTLHAAQVQMFEGHWVSSQAKLILVSKILLMTVLIILLVTSLKRLKYLLLVTCVSIGLLGIKGAMFGVRTEGQFRVWGPPDSFLADNNAFALAVNMSIPILYFLAREEPNRKLRTVLYWLFFGGIVSVLLTYSRGGLLGLAVTLAGITFKSRRKFLSGVLIALCVPLVLALAPVQWTDRMTNFVHGNLDESAQQRLYAWQFAWNLAKEYPMTGGGFDTFTPDLFERFAPEPGVWTGPHSIYFQMLGEHGFVGLGIFLCLVASCLFSLRRLRSRARRLPEIQSMVAYSNMLEISLWSYLVSGAFLELAHFDLFYQLVAATVVLKILALREVRAGLPTKTAEAVNEEVGEMVAV